MRKTLMTCGTDSQPSCSIYVAFTHGQLDVKKRSWRQSIARKLNKSKPVVTTAWPHPLKSLPPHMSGTRIGRRLEIRLTADADHIAITEQIRGTTGRTFT